MKALDEYFLMVVSTLLLNRLQVFANFMLNRETWLWKEILFVRPVVCQKCIKYLKIFLFEQAMEDQGISDILW